MREGREIYKRPQGLLLESSEHLSPEAMTDEEFTKFDEEQERFLMEVAESFPIDEDDEELKKAASEHIGERFWKGFRQFCAAGRALFSYGEPLWALQHDHVLGNTNTCAERILLAIAHKKKQILDSLAVYRGENVEIKDSRLHTFQATGDKKDELGEVLKKEKRPVMRHLVAPCSYCREGLCRHNPDCMVIMPPGILSPEKTTIKLPAFMLYPDQDLFEKEDVLEQRLEREGKTKLLQARKKQKKYFKELAKKFPLKAGDKELLEGARQKLEEIPETKRPYVLIRGRTLTDRIVEEKGEVPQPIDPADLSYIDYPRNEIEVLFVDQVLEEPPFGSVSPAPAHNLNSFIELYRDANSDEVRLMLPNADMRQRMMDRFRNSFILVDLEGQPAKLPLAAFVPNRYKRVDKKSKQGRV